eukprot:12892781-Prorocentrum_lima.AAC.1
MPLWRSRSQNSNEPLEATTDRHPNHRTGQDRTGQDRAGHVTQDRTGQLIEEGGRPPSWKSLPGIVMR